MNLELTRTFLMWCTILDYGVLILWCLLYKLGRDWHYRLTSKWFPITIEDYDRINFKGVALFKMAILLFNLIPYIALRIAA